MHNVHTKFYDNLQSVKKYMSTSDPFQLLNTQPMFAELAYEHRAIGDYLNAKFDKEFIGMFINKFDLFSHAQLQ